MNVVDLKKLYAFFSELAHVRHGGIGTYIVENADGQRFLSNYFGGVVEGYPGTVRNEIIVRPPEHRSYEFRGELGKHRLHVIQPFRKLPVGLDLMLPSSPRRRVLRLPDHKPHFE